MMMRSKTQGDTIIEVMLAFAIFAAAAVGTIAVLNNGVATTQRNLETTLVRQQIDSQAEMLRYIHNTKNPLWQSLKATTALVTSPQPLANSCTTIANMSKAFYIQPAINTANPTATTFVRKAISSATYVAPSVYAVIDYSEATPQTQGIWIQATKAQQNGPIAAYDFYIHACWDGVGTNQKMTLGTIVRIYD